MKLTSVTKLSAALALTLLSCGCAELNDPYYPSNPGYGYGNSYPYGGGYGTSYQDRRERERLERERERLEDERQRLEDERDRYNSRPPSYSPPPPRPAPEHCPSGFSPSEQKCSREERKHGCQDMRLPGGLGCVRR